MARIRWINVAAVTAIFVAAGLITVKNLQPDGASRLLGLSDAPASVKLRTAAN